MVVITAVVVKMTVSTVVVMMIVLVMMGVMMMKVMLIMDLCWFWIQGFDTLSSFLSHIWYKL